MDDTGFKIFGFKIFSNNKTYFIELQPGVVASVTRATAELTFLDKIPENVKLVTGSLDTKDVAPTGTRKLICAICATTQAIQRTH